MAKFLTITEAAKMMHVSRETIYVWIRENKIRVFRTPGGRYRVLEDDLLEEIMRPAPQAETSNSEGKE